MAKDKETRVAFKAVTRIKPGRNEGGKGLLKKHAFFKTSSTF